MKSQSCLFSLRVFTLSSVSAIEEMTISINCSIRSKVARGYNLDVGTHAPNSKHNLKLSEHNLKQSNTI